MITYFFYNEFKKSGEFDEETNKFAGLEVLFRLPFIIICDLSLLIFIYNNLF